MPGRMKQRGSLVVYAVVAIFVAAAGAAVVMTYRSAIAKAERAERELAELRDVHKETLNDNTFLRVERGRLDALLARREGVRQGEAKARGEIDAKLQELYRRDPEARAWRDQPVPDAVLVGLRLKPAAAIGAKDGAPDAAAKPDR